MVTIAIAIAISTSRTIWAIGIWTQLLCELLLLGLHELFALVLGILECLLLGLADLLDLLGSHPVGAVWVGSVSIAVVATGGGGGTVGAVGVSVAAVVGRGVRKERHSWRDRQTPH